MLLFYMFLGLKYVLWKKKDCLVYLTYNTTYQYLNYLKMALKNTIVLTNHLFIKYLM